MGGFVFIKILSNLVGLDFGNSSKMNLYLKLDIYFRFLFVKEYFIYECKLNQILLKVF